MKKWGRRMFASLLRGFFGGILVATATFGPTPTLAAPKDLVLVVDNSGSMLENDPAFLTRAAVSAFARHLDTDSRIALLLFDTTARLEVPLIGTGEETRESFAAAIGKIDFSGQRTNTPAAIERAIYELNFRGRKDALQSIVFITDGIVDTGDPEADREKGRWLREALTADARTAGIRIFAMAFTEKADFHLIQTLAQETDGRYFRVPTAADIGPTFEAIRQALDAAAPKVQEPAPPAAQLNDASAGLAGLPTPDDWDLPGTDLEQSDIQRRAAQAADQRLPATAAMQGFPLWLGIVLGAAAVVLLSSVALLIRRRQPAPTAAPVVAAAPEPEANAPLSGIALLRDLDQVTAEQTIDISTGVSVIGRVAGSETKDIRYIVVEDPAVSRRHAVIAARNFTFWISDQGSANGTEVNGERIDSEVKLNSGDIVTIHEHDFEFVMPDIDAADSTRVRSQEVNPQALIATTRIGAEEVAALLSGDRSSSASEEESVDVIDLDDFGPVETGADAEPADLAATMARDGPMPQAPPPPAPKSDTEPPDLMATMAGNAEQFAPAIVPPEPPPPANTAPEPSSRTQDAGQAEDEEDDAGLDETRIRPDQGL